MRCVGNGLAGRKDKPLRTAIEVWQVIAKRFDLHPRDSGRLHRHSFFPIEWRVRRKRLLLSDGGQVRCLWLRNDRVAKHAYSLYLDLDDVARQDRPDA